MTKKWWAAASLLIPGFALAQEPYAMGPQEPVEVDDPMLPNLLSARTGATLDLALDYIDLDGTDGVHLFASRLHGQYLTPQNIGGYVIVPVAMISGDDIDSDTRIGNIEVGGLIRVPQASGMNVMVRGGVSIDTQDQPDTLDEAILNIAAHFIPRPTDAFTIAGLNTTWARAQIQFTQRSNNIVFGAMGGVDVPVSGDLSEEDGLDALINVAGAVGYQDAKYGAAFGITFVQPMSEGDDEEVKNVFLQGNLAVNPSARLYGGFGLPLDGDEFFDGTAFMFGLRAGM